MISAFGVEHGDISKARFLTPKPRSVHGGKKTLQGYKPRGAGKPYAPSREAAQAKKKPTIDEALQAKKDFYARRNNYIKTGLL